MGTVYGLEVSPKRVLPYERDKIFMFVIKLSLPCKKRISAGGITGWKEGRRGGGGEGGVGGKEGREGKEGRSERGEGE